MRKLEKKGLLCRPANIARLMVHELEGSHQEEDVNDPDAQH